MLRCNVSPYEGKEPYLFISYRHNEEDQSIVYPILEKLENKGFRLWFDRGIEATSEWPAVVSSHLVQASACLFFVSSNFSLSQNCRDEIYLAKNKNIARIFIFLQNNVQLDPELELGLVRQQQLFLENYRNTDELLDYLKNDKQLQCCLKNGKQLQGCPAVPTLPQNAMVFKEERFRKELQDKTLQDAKQAYKDCDFQKARELYRNAYFRGNSTAGILLGVMCYEGNYCAQDFERAVHLFDDCMNRSNPLAAEWLAYCYKCGNGVPEDREKASTLFASCKNALKALAVLGSDDAQYMLGVDLLYGTFDVPAPEQGLYWLQKAADSGSVMASYHLAKAKITGNGCAKDVSAGIDELNRYIDSPDIAFLYAKLLIHGLGDLRPDQETALKLFLYAAEKGHIEAHDYVGDCYRLGLGTDIDYKASFSWYEQAAENGNVNSITSIGLQYLLGQGVPQDMKKAISFFEKACSHNSASANYFLAYIYCEKYKNIEKGVSYLQNAVNLGNRDAMNALGNALIKGSYEPILPRDVEKGRVMLRRAANRGDLSAILYMANMAMKNDPPQIKEAISLLQRATEQLSNAEATDEQRTEMNDLAIKLGRHCVKNRICGEEMNDILSRLEWKNPTASYLRGCLYRDGIGVKRNHYLAKIMFRRASDQGSKEAAKALNSFWFRL